MEDEEYEKTKTIWESRLQSGPIFGVNVDLPMTVIREKEGGLSIDCVWGQLGNFQPAAYARISLTPEAVRSLIRAMDTLEKNPDAPSVKINKPVSN